MASNPARVARRAEVVDTLSAIFRQNTCAHWIALLEQHDIPSCKVMALHEILSDPQVEVNGLVHSLEDPVRGRITTLGPPVRMSATPTEHTRVAPILGEHTAEVLRELGLSDAEIDGLRAANVIN
jgi:crotonobetainyl-CoA:carnitine CoA-transferase CaiB-like acyl-CoA transferase